MQKLDDILSSKISKRKEEGLFRTLKQPGDLIDFYSNDYLGLARSKPLFEIIHSRLEHLKPVNGSTGSRLLSGNSAYHEAIEHKLARIFNSQSTVLFNSGYTANLSVLSSIPGKDDTIIYDELSHASIKDGARLSLAKRFSFLHNDLADLEKKIRKCTGKVFVAAESVYSMDGDKCPLIDMTALTEKYGAFLILDEAHSTGVFGNAGDGLANTLGVGEKIPLRIFTFGKGMGVHGACVAGSDCVKDYMVNFARPFIYTTAPDYHALVSIDCVFDYLIENIQLQKLLQERIDFFVKSVSRIPTVRSTKSAIQTVMMPGNTNAKNAALKLQKKGIDARPILSPTVRRGSERLRICLHTYNDEKDILTLAEGLSELVAVNETDYLSP